MNPISSKPILITNTYCLSAKELTNLFWGEIFRRFWYVLLIIGGVVLFVVIKDIVKNPFPFNLIFPAMFCVIFLFAKYRFVSNLRKNPNIKRSSILSLYNDRLEFEDDQGGRATNMFSEVDRMRSSRIGFVIRLKDHRAIFIPQNCFKSEIDRKVFEETIKQIFQ